MKKRGPLILLTLYNMRSNIKSTGRYRIKYDKRNINENTLICGLYRYTVIMECDAVDTVDTVNTGIMLGGSSKV